MFTGEFASIMDDFGRREDHRHAAGNAVGHAEHGCLQKNHEFADDFSVVWMLDKYDQ